MLVPQEPHTRLCMPYRRNAVEKLQQMRIIRGRQIVRGNGRSNLHRCSASCVSLQNAMERMLIRQSLSQLRSCYATPLRECLSDSPSGGFTASSPYTGDASGVGRANSRVNCFAISLATLSPPIHPRASANLKLRTTQKPHLYVILRWRESRKIA